jgi:predicted enzyme related to lactoylglutathione lyase
MDYKTVDADTFGRSLRGIGLNLLVRDITRTTRFLKAVFDLTAHQATKDFAIVQYGDQVFQLHADGTYHSHPLLNMLPEQPPRGAGVEIHLYDTDPDAAAKQAKAHGAMILQDPTDKPHGLRETYILDDDGYVWVASRPK